MVKENESPRGGGAAERPPDERAREEGRLTDTENHRSRPHRRPPSYEKWTREALYAHARSRRIPGRSSMSKQQLINALRRS